MDANEMMTRKELEEHNKKSRYYNLWTAMIVAIDNFVNQLEEDRIDPSSEMDDEGEPIGNQYSEEELEDIEFELQTLQTAANELNDKYEFKLY